MCMCVCVCVCVCVPVSQVLIILVHCALVGFARAPYANKYATREEKVLAALERVEVFEILNSQ
jgi:hypothetical protein